MFLIFVFLKNNNLSIYPKIVMSFSFTLSTILSKNLQAVVSRTEHFLRSFGVGQFSGGERFLKHNKYKHFILKLNII